MRATCTDTAYINTNHESASDVFGDVMHSLMARHCIYDEIVFLCIGTDRATGDCLGPLTGHRLASLPTHGVSVYGTLDAPVHAKNLGAAGERIRTAHKNPLIIAVDACLGELDRIGIIEIGEGAVEPGAALHRSLPDIGHIFIQGVVNAGRSYAGAPAAQIILQNTRLNVVMKMADIICSGAALALERVGRLKSEK